MEYAHKDLPVKNWSKPSNVSEINISEITWLLPNPENAQANLLIKSLFINKPTKYDNSFNTIQIDILCNGSVTENTPVAAIRNATLIEFHSLNPSLASWENPVQEWARSDAAKEKYWNIENLITSTNNQVCEREWTAWNTILKSNIINNSNYFVWENHVEIAYRSDNTIKSLEILVNWIVAQTINTEWKKEWIYSWNMFLPWMYKNQTVSLEIRAVDSNFYSKSEVNSIIIWNKDDVNPIITMENPIDNRMKLYNTDFFNLKATIFDNSNINVTLYIDWIEYKKLWDNRKIDLAINKDNNLSIWNHVIIIEVIDSAWNKTFNNINLEVIQK